MCLFWFIGNPVSRQFMSMSSVRKSHKSSLSLFALLTAALKKRCEWEREWKKLFRWSDQADCEIAFLAIFSIFQYTLTKKIRVLDWIIHSLTLHFCFQFHHSPIAHMLTMKWKKSKVRNNFDMHWTKKIHKKGYWRLYAHIQIFTIFTLLFFVCATEKLHFELAQRIEVNWKIPCNLFFRLWELGKKSNAWREIDHNFCYFFHHCL